MDGKSSNEQESWREQVRALYGKKPYSVGHPARAMKLDTYNVPTGYG